MSTQSSPLHVNLVLPRGGGAGGGAIDVNQVDRQLDVSAGAVRVAGHVTNRRRLLIPAYIIGQQLLSFTLFIN